MTFERIVAVLVAEPFYLPLDYIAKLTDWQIAHLYFNPAIKRAQKIQAQRGGWQSPPKSKTFNKDKPFPIPREKFIQSGLKQFGGTAEIWGKQYDTANAKWEENRAMRAKNRG